jgi:RNA polymerase sigma factor (sigma-70 family)
VDRKQERAFEEFIGESGDALLRLATLLTADRGLGEDVYQETLHRLAARWSRVDNPRAFCRRVMHNIVIDQGRLNRRQVPEIRLAEGHDDSDPRSADPVSAVELRPVLFAALRTLTPHQREIVVLRYSTTAARARSPSCSASRREPSGAPCPCRGPTARAPEPQRAF